MDLKELNDNKEEGCKGYTRDMKVFQVGNSFIKRSFREDEWMRRRDKACEWAPSGVVPQRLRTDAAVIQYLRDNTDIPVPRLQNIYEDDGALFFSSEVVKGVKLSDMKEECKEEVLDELMDHIDTLKMLSSDLPGVPGLDLMCAPRYVHSDGWKSGSCWRPKYKQHKYSFCHNNLTQNNVIVNPKTLKIKAIIGWEYAGFWPGWFEKPYWEEAKPIFPLLQHEKDHAYLCRKWLVRHCEEERMKWLLSMEEKVANARRKK